MALGGPKTQCFDQGAALWKELRGRDNAAAALTAVVVKRPCFAAEAPEDFSCLSVEGFGNMSPRHERVESRWQKRWTCCGISILNNFTWIFGRISIFWHLAWKWDVLKTEHEKFGGPLVPQFWAMPIVTACVDQWECRPGVWICPLCFVSVPAGGCPLMLVAAVGVSLVVPCAFSPPWGVSVLVVVIGVLFLAPLWCSSSSLGWLWFGVCLLALRGFRQRWGVSLPSGGCGWRAGASACIAVFLFPFGCCGGHLSFSAGSLVPSARSIPFFCLWFGPPETGREDLQWP